LANKQHGFTLVELLVVIAVVGVVAGAFFHFFVVNYDEYIHLQADASGSSAIATQSQRIASVVRGATGIIAASPNDLQIYAYFYPTDTYVSIVHYYLNSTSTVLYTDVTPMSSNPPLGTPLTSQLQTYTIISNFYEPNGVSLFTYLDASNTALTSPISDLNAIKEIQVNLAIRTSGNTDQTLNLLVDLRNRKTNL
jgi:prepilin-type N-terminal cleavage/methylation domain-containing protein